MPDFQTDDAVTVTSGRYRNRTGRIAQPAGYVPEGMVRVALAKSRTQDAVTLVFSTTQLAKA